MALQDFSPEDQRAFLDEYKKCVAEAFKIHDEIIREQLRNVSEETKLMRSLLWAMVNLGQKEEALKILAELGITPEEAIFGKKNNMKGKKQTESEAKE